MITLNGPAKTIILSGATTFLGSDIYAASYTWAALEENMQYITPLDASSELLYTLRYGWKIQPSGYSANTVIVVNGKITTTEGDVVKTVPATVGSQVTWQFDTPATAILVPVGETVNVWNEPPTVEEIAAGIGDIEVSGMTVEQDALLREAAAAASQAELNTY